jgi:hypothetical protein
LEKYPSANGLADMVKSFYIVIYALPSIKLPLICMKEVLTPFPLMGAGGVCIF